MKILLALLPLTLCATDWPGFRGVNGSGTSPESRDLPQQISPDQNVVWRTPLPPGYSSPALGGSRVFVTAHESGKVFTIALDRVGGQVLWRREPPAGRPVPKRSVNTPVSPTPATDGLNVYVFFEHFGLVSYGPDGNERWNVPLGPFKNPYGMGASPVLAGDSLLMVCDNDVDSFLVALDSKTGKERWRRARPEVTHGFSTPILYRPKQGPAQVIVSGSYQLVSYSLASGEKLWWVGGMAWQAKSTPIVQGDTLYVHSWMADMAGVGLPSRIDAFDEVLATHDKDKDGKISSAEAPYDELKKLFFLFDLNQDRVLDRAEWEALMARNTAQNGVYAIKLDGRQGDLSKTNVLWRYNKSLPNIPSPLFYNDALFLLREGGILTSLNPSSGEVVKQGRLQGALDPYYASPVAGDGKLYLVSQSCKVSVVKAAGEWEVLAVNDLKDDCWSTPAIADGRIFIRTQQALYCFGKKG